MSMNDPIADLLTRIRNANMIGRKSVDIPSSKIKVGIVRVLEKEGFVNGFKEADDGIKKTLVVYLKYGPMKKKIINYIRRESKCGRRVYKKIIDIGSVFGGIGISIYSTSKGILSDKECRNSNIGGELMCTIW